MTATLARPDYRLSDNLEASGGQIFLTGTQALVRLTLMQRSLDAARGLATQGFISGYRGSPLGVVDKEVWKAKKQLDAQQVRFLPAINEELGATAVLGTQRVESDPERTADGVFAMWYGKGPGVDRAGDALRHGNAYGSSPRGGVLVVAGDDHGCVSSSMPHQSDIAFQAWAMPCVSPGNIAEYLEFGLYGWALSRYSGNWVGFTALSEVVESAGTVDLDLVSARVQTWADAATVDATTGLRRPADGLHYRWPDLPSLKIEQRLQLKLSAVRAFARINSIDRDIVHAPRATVGIVTCGKAHYDLMEVFRRLDISMDMLAAAGVRLYKVGLSFPIEPTRMRLFAQGLREVLVIEEKAGVVEQQLRDLLYNAPVRPAVLGKLDAKGKALISSLGELRPSALITPVAQWLARHFPHLDRSDHVTDFTPPQLLSNTADWVKRIPYFCAGCPHNISTRVPEGSRAQAGIGCHFMASWMNRDTAGLIQMGGEGVDWVSHSQFTRVPHVFQNLGDGTYYHSGYLAIRQAIAAGTNVTYKILFNDAVAMTGGQPVDGIISVDAIARQVEAEGAKRVVVVSDYIDKYKGQENRFPSGTQFHAREKLDAVQRELREVKGVTVLIYEQTCAAEKRRRRKKGELVEPARRLYINEAVCEGCGDCTVQSNCIAVLPLPTDMGRKRKIDQSSCNKDYSCAKGFCPSFVGVVGGKLRKPVGALAGAGGSKLMALVENLDMPAPHQWTGPYDLLVTGVGGTGVVTVGTLIAMAAHLEGKVSSVLDFMGFAQKGGAVLSFVRLAQTPDLLNQVRIDCQQADAVLACDAVVAASPEALGTMRHGRTRALVNLHELPVAESLTNPDASLKMEQLLDKIRFGVGEGRVDTLDAQRLAEDFLGDSIYSNMIAMGFAWQLGLLPLSLEAFLRAIELNNVAVENNKLAFSLGRYAAAEPQACSLLLNDPGLSGEQRESLDALVQRAVAFLTDYQSAKYAQRFRTLVDKARQHEDAVFAAAGDYPFTRAVATSMLKLMAYKDEYEVARLYAQPDFMQRLNQQFEGDFALEFYLAPPALRKGKGGAAPTKVRFGAWMLPVFRVLALGKALRGTAFDVFGRSQERRMERALVDAYEARIREVLTMLDEPRRTIATEIAGLPQTIRGFGHVKLADVAMAKAREAELLHRLDRQKYVRPTTAPVAGQFKGIAVTAR